MDDFNKVFYNLVHCLLFPTIKINFYITASFVKYDKPPPPILLYYPSLHTHNIALVRKYGNMEISILNVKSRCKLCLEGIMLGVLTILAYVNSVYPSCVYFIIISRLRKQTSAESEHFNQNQNQIALVRSEIMHISQQT